MRRKKREFRCEKIRNFWPYFFKLPHEGICVSSGGKNCYLAWLQNFCRLAASEGFVILSAKK